MTALLIAAAFVHLWTHAAPAVAGFDLRNGACLAALPIASKLSGHGLALDGNTLIVAGRRALWAYRLQQ